MQSKGAVKLFAITMALVCLYQLSFTWVTGHWEDNAKEYANGDPSKEKAYIDSISGLPVYNLGFKNFTYRECKENELNLGLDLKGGMNVTMEVSLVDLVRAMSNYSNDPTFNKAIDNASKAQIKSQKDFVTLFGEEFIKLDPNAKLAAIFATKDLQEKISFTSTNEQVLKIISEEADAAFNRTYQILKTRIDKFGVAQPNVQKLGSGRILVELPGIKEPERVRKLLQGTAKLEFWETFDNTEIYPALEAVNKLLVSTGMGDSLDNNADTSLALSDSLSVRTDSLTAQGDTTKKSSLMQELAGTKKDTSVSDTSDAGRALKAAKDNPLFAILNPSYFQNENNQTELTKGPVIGLALVKDTAKINHIFSMEQVIGKMPRNFKPYWTVKSVDKDGKVFQLVAIKTPAREQAAPLDGSVITDARKQKSQFSDRWEVSMSMDAEGARTWKKLTHDNVNKSIAVVLDEYVYSYPNVIQEISGGNSSITGNFSLEEAEDLANILKVGKLPAPARIVEDTVVGPTLGKEAISNSLISFIVAFIIILLFMGAYYMRAGWVANVALFVNIFFIMGILASLGAVLTLPGIAGIVLTIGLSVDANILIFERVREELRHGKGTRLAISDGFKHAMSSILDSNITLLILGIVLYIFGTGPIQGFATTLVIGVLSSLFAAVLITRLIFEWLLEKNKTINFSNKVSENIYKGVHFNFVKNRKYYYIFSSIVILAGVVSFAMKGLNYGVDFKGGRTYIVQMDQPVTIDQIRHSLSVPFESAPEVKTIGNANRFKIATPYLIDDTSSTIEVLLMDKLYNGLKPLYAAAPDPETFRSKFLISSQKVGGTIAEDIKQGALWAILISCGLMFLYIFVRFRKWQYGLGATVALLHDVLFVLSLFSLLEGIVPFALEIDQHFVAAILTVMGYTMTESVVVFDRIREYLGVHHTADDKFVINDALNATLSRTINTTLTVFFVLVVIFIFGGEVIRGFIFALLVGRIIGTYSSLCIATPIVIDFQGKDKTPAIK